MSTASFINLFEQRGDYIPNDAAWLQAMETINADCQPWLSESQGIPAWRGISISKHDAMRDHDKIIGLFTPRPDRKPTDMDSENHVLIDNALEKKFMWRPRQEGVFVTGSRWTAEDYGKSALVFPKGQFSFVWNPDIDDLVNHIPSRQSVFHGQVLDDITFYNRKIKPLVDGYRDNDLVSALRSGNEVIIGCSEFYLVNPYFAMEFVDKLRIWKKNQAVS